jgi:hypothetical protein
VLRPPDAVSPYSDPYAPAQYSPVPPAAPSRQGALAAVAAGVVALAVVGLVATFALFGKTTTPGGPVAADEYVPPVAAPSEVTESTTQDPTTPSPQPVPADPATALDELNLQVEADRADAEALVDRWVPQLSAKRPGLVANGVTYDHDEILADFRATQTRYPDALLLYSGEYSSFKNGDFWITVMPLPHADGPAANSWCDGQGIGPDDCYAKMISHTVGYDAATLLRK